MDLHVMAEVRGEVFRAVELPQTAVLGGEEEVAALLCDAAVELLFFSGGNLGVVVLAGSGGTH
jgi:hypothetical protein